MFESVRRVAGGLYELGIRAGSVVPVFSVNTPETLYCIFALNIIGAVPLLEYVTESTREAEEAVKQSESGVIIILDALLTKFGSLAGLTNVKYVVSLPISKTMPVLKKVAYRMKAGYSHCAKEISFRRITEIGLKTVFVESKYVENTPAVILHSGGTTGVPKGVVLSDDNINYVAWAFHVGGHDGKRGDLFYTCIPLFHAFGFVSGTIMPLTNQCTLVLAVKFDELSFINTFKNLCPQHTLSSSTYLPALIKDNGIQKMDLSFYKTMGMGGTPISPSMEIELCDFMEKHGSCAKASVGYGMSELASAACTELNRYYGKTGSVGLPLAYVNIKVIDTETEREMMLGEEGELVISSPGLMIEYFNNPEETKTAISTDEEGVRWIKTGDLGYVDEDGFVFITQKLKRIYTTRKDVNSPIFHIFPDYIANVICEVENVEECVVVCLQHPELKSVPVAFCVIQDHTFDCIPVIKEYCRNHLPAHSIPHEFCEIDEIPKTVIGKPDYQALEKMAQIQSEVTPGVK